MSAFFARFGAFVVAIVVVFNLAPLVVILGSSLSGNRLLEFPPTSISFKWYELAATSDKLLVSLGLSVFIAVLSAAFVTMICALAALVTVRQRFVGRSFFEFAAIAPLALPHAATALVLLKLAQSFGIVGQPSGFVLAHSIVVLPFGYLLCVAGLAAIDVELEEAAMALGANPISVFGKVTLPLMAPSIIGSFLFCFLMSFDESTVSLFLRGVDVVTVPVAVFMLIQDEANPLVSAISGILIAITVVVLWLTKRAVGLRLFVNQSH